jgi:hypothetical protein
MNCIFWNIVVRRPLGPRGLAQQLRQLGDVGGDAPGLVAGEEMRRRASGSGTAGTIACARRRRASLKGTINVSARGKR